MTYLVSLQSWRPRANLSCGERSEAQLGTFVVPHCQDSLTNDSFSISVSRLSVVLVSMENETAGQMPHPHSPAIASTLEQKSD